MGNRLRKSWTPGRSRPAAMNNARVGRQTSKNLGPPFTAPPGAGRPSGGVAHAHLGRRGGSREL
eukprot:5477112-Lingulodinium_polyedra.AAC.1